jgi:hypothetical protein
MIYMEWLGRIVLGISNLLSSLDTSANVATECTLPNAQRLTGRIGESELMENRCITRYTTYYRIERQLAQSITSLGRVPSIA